MKKQLKKTYFTLIEVMVSMGVFAILMLALMMFFSSAQKLWERTGSRTAGFDEARTVMNLMAQDLASLFYQQDFDQSKYQFYYSSTNGDELVFPIRDSEGNKEVAYKWASSYTDNGTTYNTGILYRKVEAEPASPDNTWFTRGKTWISTILGSTVNSSNELMRDVLYFNVEPFTIVSTGTGLTTFSSSSQSPIPDMIKITIITVSQETLEKMKAREKIYTDETLQNFFNGKEEKDKTQYVKADGSLSSSSDKKSIKDCLLQGLVPSDNPDSAERILYDGCQVFTRLIYLNQGK